MNPCSSVSVRVHPLRSMKGVVCVQESLQSKSGYGDLYKECANQVGLTDEEVRQIRRESRMK